MPRNIVMEIVIFLLTHLDEIAIIKQISSHELFTDSPRLNSNLIKQISCHELLTYNK